MSSKPWLAPAPAYHPLQTFWNTERDAPGPRCGHTLTAVAQSKSHGPRLILFGGATAIDGAPSSTVAGIRLAGVTNSVHEYDVLTRKWTRIQPDGEPPSRRAAHAAAAVGTMVVFQGGIGPAGNSTDDLYVLDLTNGKYKWHRMVVRGQGPGPRYGHVMDLVAQRYLVTVSGSDGKKVLSDAWALDTAQKPYAWQRLNPEGDKPSARMYATASARSDGMFLLCGGRDSLGTPLADAYGLLMHRNGQWEWTLAPGVSPSPRYHHASVCVGARLHVTGGVLRGGRTVDGEAAVAVLDTAAGVWLDRHGMVTSSNSKGSQTDDPSLELMHRCRHAASSVGGRLYVYGGLKGDVLLDDFLIAEDSPDSDSPMLSSKTTSNVTNPFGPMCPDNRPASPSGGLSMNKESMERLAEASAAEAQAANAVWQAAQAHAANPEELPGPVDSQPAESNLNGGDTEGDVRLHPRAVVVANETVGNLGGLVRQLSLDQFENESVLRNLGVDPEEKKPKRVSKKKVTVAGGATVKKTEVTGTTSVAAFRKGGQPQGGVAAGARSSGSAGSKGPESGATPTSIQVEETEADPGPEELIRKNVSKRSRAETKSESTPPAKKVAARKPSIGKKGSLSNLYTEVSLEEVTKKSAAQPKITVIPPKTAIDITSEVEKTPEVVKAAGDEQPIFERMDTGAWVEKRIVQQAAPIQIERITQIAEKSAGNVHEEGHVETQNVEGAGAGCRKDSPHKSRIKEPSSIRPEDTLGDIYYKSYDESRANEIHAPVWKVKQGDTFADFVPCREWFMGAFPPGEVRHQRERGHDALYRSHVYAQANCASTSHQITREWRTMYLERSSWEKHRERLAAEAKLFEQAKAQLVKEKETFEQEKRSEEWGLQGLKKKLQASEDTLAEARRKWRVACENENKRMFAVRTENSNLKSRVEELKKSESDYKDKYEEAKSHRERVEVLQGLQVELSQQIISKDKDLADKDVEIAELQRRLREAQESLEAERQKSDSLEIDLAAEKVKAETAEKARKVSQTALNVAQENYAEVQSTVEPLITDLGWMQHYGVAHIANSILNAPELDRAVAALTMAARAAGHRAGYMECAAHVEEALRTQFGTPHCSVSERAEEGLLKAEENYDNLSLPIMDLVTEALNHEDYVARLRSIFEPSETVQLTDDEDEDEAGDDGAE